MADLHEYALVDPSSVHEDENDFFVLCSYDRADIRDEDTILEDHARIGSQITLRRLGDASSSELPILSGNISDWAPAILVSRDLGVWWEGCGPSTPCADGDEPTVRTYARQTLFEGHVGNLEFYVRVTFISERLPADAESRNLVIFRDLVLAVVESYDRIN